jgi:hypothetical protein
MAFKDGDRVEIAWPDEHFSHFHGMKGNIIVANHGWMREVDGEREILARVQLDGIEKIAVVSQKHLIKI